MTQTVRDLVALGYNATQIADIKDCSTAAVKRYCLKNEITFKTQTEETIPESFKKYFQLKLDSTNPALCWNWTGSKNKFGYGVVFYNSILSYAHRVAHKIYNDVTFNIKLEKDLDKDSIVILHSCDNPSCCNPAHLSTGTPLENVQDMVRKGRQGRRKRGLNLKGEYHR